MFSENGVIFRSSLLDLPGICHGFSTRTGGVSTHPYTRSMNLAMGREDSDDTVRENAEIFAVLLSDGRLHRENMVTASQIHSATVRILTRENCGEGVVRAAGEDCDGFVTDEPGVLPTVRTADCTPILLAGQKNGGAPVIGVVHAGWRGSAAGIVRNAVEMMVSLGALRESVRAAIGPHIGTCCYEVGEDMRQATADMAGEAFAETYCTPRDPGPAGEPKFTADLTGMNLQYLRMAGVTEERVDICPLCTMCDPGTFHSHRATAGRRGAMGASIGIPD